MGSNLTSKYTIDLVVKNDKSQEAVRALEKGFKNVGEMAKKAGSGKEMGKNLNEAQKAADAMIAKFKEMATDTEVDFKTISKGYSKYSNQAINALERSYATLKDQLNEAQTKENEYMDLIEKLKTKLNDDNLKLYERVDLMEQIGKLEDKKAALEVNKLDAQVKQNRQIRFNLKAAEQTVRQERLQMNYKKLNNAYADKKQAKDKKAKEALDKEIKDRKLLIKTIKEAEKAQNAMTKAIGRSAKEESRLNKIIHHVERGLQMTYNATGLIGGAGRMIKGGLHAASSGLNMISQASDKALERERASSRVKGMDAETASAMIGDVYIKTGANYDEIVDAINNVRTVLGNVSKDELASAAAIEVRYPGMSTAFASTDTESSIENFNAYANRMKAVQKATGASEEQLKASTQKMANYQKNGAFNNATVSELQAIYHGLQNSGAFESQEELDNAFDRFVRSRKNSKNKAWEDAQSYDWTKTMRKSRDKLQIENTLQKNMDWQAIGNATKDLNTNKPEQTAAEKNVERMRRMEERRNEMMIKLVDILEPIINELEKLLNSDSVKKIIRGVIKFFAEVVPKLTDILIAIAKGLGVSLDALNAIAHQNEEQTQRQIDAAAQKSPAAMLAYRDGLDKTMRFANGGVALGPALIGERGPEAIIPLDYSRAQRAQNIANTVNQTFNMSGNQTTALSLSQAVRSRDFTRAMTDNQFFTRRCGAF